jgi:hypothetical protein
MKYPARLTSADPITSNSGKFMSLQELEEQIFAKSRSPMEKGTQGTSASVT